MKRKRGQSGGGENLFFNTTPKINFRARTCGVARPEDIREEKQDPGCARRLARIVKNMCNELETSDQRNPTEKGIQSKFGVKKSYILIPS